MSMGDDTVVPPAIGKYHNVLLYYEANQKSYLYSSDGIPTLLVNGVTDYEQAVNLPQINGVTLLGDKSSADLGLADAPMVINVASGNTSWSGADTAEDVYNFFLNKGKVNIIFSGDENYSYEIASAAYIPEEEKMMCTLAVATIATGETAEFEGNALFGTMTLYTAGKAIDVSQIELQPKLYITDFTGLDLNYNELSGVPATNASIGMVKPGDGLEVSSDGTMSVTDVEQYAHFFDTVSDMKTATNLINGSYAKTLGFYSPDDGGGAVYQITNTGTANEMDVISVNGLYAHLVTDELNIKQLGAKGDNSTDNSTILSHAIANYNNILIPEGIFAFSTVLVASNQVNIHGVDRQQSKLHYTNDETNDYIITLGAAYSTIRDLAILGPYPYSADEPTTGYSERTVSCITCASNTFVKDAYIRSFKNGIHISSSWCSEFNNVDIERCYRGIDGYSASNNNNISITKCGLRHNAQGIALGQGRSQSLIDCDIELNDGNAIRNNSNVSFVNCYFEDAFTISSGGSGDPYNVVFMGCSWYFRSSLSQCLYCNVTSKVTMINCIIANPVESDTRYAIRIINNKSAILENTTITSGNLVNLDEYQGIIVNNGVVENYTHSNYFTSLSNTQETVLSTDNPNLRFIFNSTESATATVKIPVLTDPYHLKIGFEFNIAVQKQNRPSSLVIEANDSTTTGLYGGGTKHYSDVSSGLIKIIYLGIISDKQYWNVVY